MLHIRKRLFGALLALMLLIGLTGYVLAETAPGYTDVSPQVAWALMDAVPELVVIDVSPMYKQGHLPGAINHPVGDGSLDEAIPSLDKGKTYLIYCQGEAPARQGAAKLVEAGFEKVFRLQGEYPGWVAAGYPIAAYVDVAPQVANALMKSIPDLVIIDVSPMYDQGHLPGAINHPVGDGQLDEAIKDLDMNKTYLIYCQAEAPSIAGATKLIEAGFNKVFRLQGEYKGWVDAGFPVE